MPAVRTGHAWRKRPIILQLPNSRGLFISIFHPWALISSPKPILTHQRKDERGYSKIRTAVPSQERMCCGEVGSRDRLCKQTSPPISGRCRTSPRTLIANFSMNWPNVSLIIVVSPVIFFLYYLLSLCAQFYKFPLQLSLLVPSLYIRANSNIGADFELIFYRLRISLLHTLSPTHSLPQF